MQWNRLLAAAGLTSLLSACAGLGSTPNVALDYQPELFSSTDTHTSRFAYPPGVTCEAARRALLSQGYNISEAKADQVRGRKLFQPEVDRHVELEFRVVCAGQGADQRVTEAFANGVQDQYGMRKVKSSASLGVGGVGSVSLPVQGDNDTLVKIGSHTITDPKMYRRFFVLMMQHLDPHASLGDVPAPAAQPSKVAEAARPVAPSAPVQQQPVVVVLPMNAMMPSMPPVSSSTPSVGNGPPEAPPASAGVADLPALSQPVRTQQGVGSEGLAAVPPATAALPLGAAAAIKGVAAPQ